MITKKIPLTTRVEVKIDEDLVPWGVNKFLECRYGEISELSFHFTREDND